MLAVPRVRLRWLTLREATWDAVSRRSRRPLTRPPGQAVRDRVGAVGLAELDAFRLGRDVLRDMAGAEDLAARQALTDALVAVAEGHHQFDAAIKREAFTRARSHLSRCIASLLLADPAPDAPAARCAAALEAAVLPRLAGLIRWAEALPTAPRAMA